MKKILSLLILFGLAGSLVAQEAASKVYYPESSHVPACSATPGGSLFISIIYLIFLAGLAVAVYFVWKRKNIPCSVKPALERILDVTATRPLGNRQFLVAVRYGRKEILLGVGQGFITPLASAEVDALTKKGAKA